MRTGLYALSVVLLTLALGGTCLPLVDNITRQALPGETLSISLAEPNQDRTIPQGTPISIKWAAANLTDEPATLTFLAESRKDLSRTELRSGLPLEGTGGSDTLLWDTTSFKGLYVIVARIQAGGDWRKTSAAGQITVDAPPSFVFTAPAGSVTFDPNEGETLAIEWTATDESATLRIGLDPDTDHSNGDEIYIHEVQLSEAADDETPSEQPATETAKRRMTWQDVGAEDPNAAPTDPNQGALAWTGNNSAGQPVAAGTYNLFATLSDDVNEVLTIDAPGQITIPAPEEDPNATQGPAFTKPAVNTEFLTTATSIPLEFTVNQSSDVLVDLKIDTDDDHANGNERTILSQHYVAADSDPNAYDWPGTDSAGGTVGPGLYRLFMAISFGEGTPATLDAEGLVLRRTDPNQPLIGLIAPTALTRVDPGQTVTIKWRDEDPTAKAKVRLVVATTADPNAHEEDAAIMSDRAAIDDGVRDTYAWQVPASGLTLETVYYILAYIENEDGVLKSNSVAAGRIIVNDPTKQ
jgi:hypothetical protein